MTEKRKHSLWMTPSGDAGKQLQALVSKLARDYGAPDFTPHITLAGSIHVNEAELAEEKRKISELAGMIGKFSVTLTDYSYLEEAHRSLFLLTNPHDLHAVYQKAATLFPQIESEHFAGMPHMSVLYGQFPEETKHTIIAAHPLQPITFDVASLDLYQTEGPENEWHQVHSATLQ